MIDLTLDERECFELTSVQKEFMEQWKLRVLDAEKEKIEHVYCDENYSDYFIIGFYEAEKEEPSLIIQLDKLGHDDWISAKKEWLKYLGLYKVYPKFEISESDIQELFPNTDKTKVKQFTDAVNEYSAYFEINSLERMSHFLGQVAVETGELKKLKESSYFKPRTIVETFPQAKYGHLYQKAVFNEKTFDYSYVDVCFDENNCIDDPNARCIFCYGTNGLTMNKGMAPDINNEFPYLDQNQVRAAYIAVKDSLVQDTINSKLVKYLMFPKVKTATKEMVSEGVSKEYGEGLIRVKDCYNCKDALFDVVYCCRLGNDNIKSKDGSTFSGAGVLHMTGKEMYFIISNEWNKDWRNKNNKKYFYKREKEGGHFEELIRDYDVAVKAGMYFWKIKGINEICKTGKVEEVTLLVNGGANGLKDRIKYTADAKRILNQ